MIQRQFFGLPVYFFNMDSEKETIDRIIEKLKKCILPNTGYNDGTVIDDGWISVCKIAEEEGGDLVASVTPQGRTIFTKVATE